MNVDAWNYVLLGNAAMLAVAGFLFGWDKALYSIVFQFASTQIVHMLNPRYKRTTLFIISDKSEDIYEHIKDSTHHGATQIRHAIVRLGGTQPQPLFLVARAEQTQTAPQNGRDNRQMIPVD